MLESGILAVQHPSRKIYIRTDTTTQDVAGSTAPEYLAQSAVATSSASVYAVAPTDGSHVPLPTVLGMDEVTTRGASGYADVAPASNSTDASSGYMDVAANQQYGGESNSDDEDV